MDYRHEWKHEISYSDMITLRQRFRALTKPDPNAKDGRYHVRSLYFDNIEDKALLEKLSGLNIREKFRLRYYNEDCSLIRLEKKTKIGGLGNKQSVTITEDEVKGLLHGEYQWLKDSNRPLLLELYSKMLSQGLQPKTIVDYTREPFIYGPGNVRITLDHEIKTGLRSLDFLNPNSITVPVDQNPIILEVKWDEFLPGIIKDAVQLNGRRSSPYSKYAASRMYG